MISFWSTNLGLAWMAFANLFPLGIVQLYYAVDTGYWQARSAEFLNLPWVNMLEWARLPGDVLFITGGALPLLWLCWQALRYPNPRSINAEADLPRMLFTEDIEPSQT
jgi:nitric oxide reductase subunit B